MVHIVGRPAAEIFSGFEDVDPRSVLGAGDVKYHVGATGTFGTSTGKQIAIHLVSNPSHLEAVDPVTVRPSAPSAMPDVCENTWGIAVLAEPRVDKGAGPAIPGGWYAVGACLPQSF